MAESYCEDAECQTVAGKSDEQGRQEVWLQRPAKVKQTQAKTETRASRFPAIGASGTRRVLRSLHSHYITYDEACASVDTLAVVCRKLLTLKADLTINWHAAMHYAEYVPATPRDSFADSVPCVCCFRFIHLYGPLSGFGTWAFERYNGWLSRVSHNKKPSEVR